MLNSKYTINTKLVNEEDLKNFLYNQFDRAIYRGNEELTIKPSLFSDCLLKAFITFLVPDIETNENKELIMTQGKLLEDESVVRYLEYLISGKDVFFSSVQDLGIRNYAEHLVRHHILREVAIKEPPKEENGIYYGFSGRIDAIYIPDIDISHAHITNVHELFNFLNKGSLPYDNLDIYVIEIKTKNEKHIVKLEEAVEYQKKQLGIYVAKMQEYFPLANIIGHLVYFPRDTFDYIKVYDVPAIPIPEYQLEILNKLYHDFKHNDRVLSFFRSIKSYIYFAMEILKNYTLINALDDKTSFVNNYIQEHPDILQMEESLSKHLITKLITNTITPDTYEKTLHQIITTLRHKVYHLIYKILSENELAELKHTGVHCRWCKIEACPYHGQQFEKNSSKSSSIFLKLHKQQEQTLQQNEQKAPQVPIKEQEQNSIQHNNKISQEQQSTQQPTMNRLFDTNTRKR